MDNKKLKFYTVTEEYMIYLKKYDEKVMDNRGVKNKRPYIGVLFEIDRKKYLAPLSSPKPKHLTMKNSLDFVKINQGKFGVINLNNMFPVIEEVIIEKNINLEEDNKYKELLVNQLDWCNKMENRDNIYRKAEKLYKEILNKKEQNRFWNRCCNFSLLEEKAIEFISLEVNID
ncbi:type III toxin-antitoxin system ToxN/AbiQ family toxin [uncultured Fusobacterium sp.]|uniref:type III toxin-antitoxin system ToxN/AbiQ family toxin n=1 Tax=uncultured Fusobacterium sp. TaxID=159267 RepID=UPI0027DE7E7E|nr:type III toxin-antitoxin system ToxN/AbiQ family toxin [uncultured Fusobacterium sp.]